jgi:hypothetical protein
VRTDSKPGDKRIVFVPDFEVLLRNRDTGEKVTVRTDVYGRYYFPEQKPGTYLLSWTAQRGLAEGEFRAPLVLANGEAYPPQIELAAQKGRVLLVGRVTFANGDMTGFIQEVYGLIKTPVLKVSSPELDLSLVVPADYRGDYVAGIDARFPRAGFTIKATLDGGEGEKELKQNLEARGVLIADLAIKNAAPRIGSIVVRDAEEKLLRHGQPGQKVSLEIEATDADKDQLEARWMTTKDLEPQGLKAKWIVPEKPGVYPLEAVVTDGRGGYGRGQLAFAVGKKFERFAGSVVDKITQRPVARAEVEVNGTRGQTATNGFFQLEVPLSDTGYVLNVSMTAYATASQTFDRGSTGRVWALVRTHSIKVDSTKEIALADERPEWLRQNKLATRLLVPPNALVDENGDHAQGPVSGSIATLDISDNEAPGDWAARGPDTRDTALISYGVAYVEFTDAAGRRLNLQKGASARVEIPVAAGRVAGRILEQAPATIPVWSYDEKTGYWAPSGEAKIDRSRGVYVGEVKHFSTINMDQAGSASCLRVLVDPQLLGKTLKISDVAGDGIDYATIKQTVLDDPVNAIYRIPPSQKVRIEVLNGTTALTSDVVIEEFDTTASQLGWQKLGSNEVNAGAALGNLWPSYPYGECPKWITLRFAPSGVSGDAFLAYKAIGDGTTTTNYYNLVSPGGLADAGNRGTLAKWWQVNGFSNTGSSPGGGADYHRTSYLNDNDLGSGRDMHFLRRTDGTVAAYVSNYGQFNQDQNNADLAAAQNNAGAKVATVCMEWSPMENAQGDRLDKAGNILQQGVGETLATFQQRVRDAAIVKFFVYVDDDANGVPELRQFADLDGYGNKFVPNLCLNCHSGIPKSAADFATGNLGAPDAATRALAVNAAELRAAFRELDYETYKFAGGALLPDPPQKAEFKSQNDQVRSGNNDSISTAEIKNIIDLWYSGGSADVDQQPILPVGWTKPGAQAAAQVMENLPNFDWSTDTGQPFQNFAAADQPDGLYTNVVAKSCRTCHAAFGHDAAQAYNLNYHDYPQYLLRRSTIGYFINTTPSSYVMPHAVITYRNFWLSGHLGDPIHRPTFLRQYQDVNWPQLGP